ncbi:hypothetical protein T484DRAFT_2280225 [Baffinella frigidus]|nr:hypothetical protein T484DRAFT_2280225 [Cryptophyta sp. CCMP2293]
MMVERPASAGRKDADAQTDEKDLDGASGLSEMRLRFQQQDEVLRQLESDRFSQRLEIADLVSTSKEQAARLTEQLNRLTKDNTSLKAKVESLLATEESYADLIVKVKEENTNLNQKIQVLSAEHASFKHDADNKTAALSDTLKAERAHFKAERTSWLSSFVTERYDLLNAVEAAARKAGHEHAAPRPADDRVRSDLWGQVLTSRRPRRACVRASLLASPLLRASLLASPLLVCLVLP